MLKRMVDVYDKNGKLLHTYPIILGGQNYVPTEEEFIDHALKAARDDNLVPEPDLSTLKARVRV